MRQSSSSPAVQRGVGDDAVAQAPEGWTPVEGAWSQTAPWNDSARSRRLGIMAGVSLGFLACLAVAGATIRSLSPTSPELACSTASSCNELGSSHSSGRPAEDLTLAARLFQRACDKGSAQGCNNLGLAYLAAKGVTEDHATAMSYFARACSGGFAEGCNNQGALYEHGQGVPVNLGDAQRLYAQACRHGSALGCSNLGVLYAEGRGVAVNHTEAARLFAEACSGGSALGCKNLSESQPSPSVGAP